MADPFEFMPGVPAAGHIFRGYWHPGAIQGCRKCVSATPAPVAPTPVRTLVRTEKVDTGGMFDDTLEIWAERDGWFTAVAKDGWNQTYGTMRCASQDAAHRACYDLLNQNLGLTGDLREGPY